MSAHITRVVLRPGQWVLLPGTDVEILLHGKLRTAVGTAGAEMTLMRTGPVQTGGWPLDTLVGVAYARRAT